MAWASPGDISLRISSGLARSSSVKTWTWRSAQSSVGGLPSCLREPQTLRRRSRRQSGSQAIIQQMLTCFGLTAKLPRKKAKDNRYPQDIPLLIHVSTNIHMYIQVYIYIYPQSIRVAHKALSCWMIVLAGLGFLGFRFMFCKV